MARLYRWVSERDNRGGFAVTERDGEIRMEIWPEGQGDRLVTVAELVVALARAKALLESMPAADILARVRANLREDNKD